MNESINENIENNQFDLEKYTDQQNSLFCLVASNGPLIEKPTWELPMRGIRSRGWCERALLRSSHSFS
jgi:hypothetical protein